MARVLNLKVPGRKKALALASGLFWHPIMPSAHPHRAIQKIAVEQSVDLYATPRTCNLQSGFGSVREGLRPGLLAIAAIISDYMEAKHDSRSFLVALPIDAGTWAYVAQHNGVILPDGDTCGDETTIQQRMHADYASGDWTHVAAPAAWGWQQAIPLELPEVLAWVGAERVRHKSWQLRKVQADYKKLALAMAVVLAATYGGWQAWQRHAAAELAREAEASQAALLQAQAQMPVAPPPWKTQSGAPAAAASCLSALAKADAFSTGWLLKSASCRGGSLSLVWDRNVGTIERMRALFPTAKIELSGNLASVGVPLPATAVADAEITLPSVTAAADHLLSRAQELGVALALTQEPPPAALPGEAPAAPPAWTAMKWRVSDTRQPPTDLVRHLDSPSLRLSAIDFDATTQAWTLEGELYANP